MRRATMNNESSAVESHRSNYSKEEQLDIYALGRMCLESGQVKRAQVILRGLTTVAPEFVPGWLATAVAQATLGNVEQSLDAARQALKLQPDSAIAMIILVTTSLTLGDQSTAGTYLGELNDMIEQGAVSDPNLIRLFKMQMVRYNSPSL
jgi:Flp pilus assembly protein TadD